ncbi:MAG: tannase/feruloyl esterase family alpha/beta hydrolase [Acidimicrobiia bacterium]
MVSQGNASASTIENFEGLLDLEVVRTTLTPDAAVEAVFIDLVEHRPSGGGHVYVEGRIRVVEPGPADVGFNLALPDAFGGRYFLNAQGGAGGELQATVDGLVQDGFAMASTDKGVSTGHVFDLSYFKDEARRAEALNYAGRATHVTAQVTQHLTRRYYDVDHLHRYIAGCSAGGIAAWQNIRREGTRDFDGALAGDFPTPTALISIQWARVMQHMDRNPASWIPPDLLRAGEAAILAAYDGVDGAVDGMIQDDRLIDFDTDVLARAGFSDAQIEAFLLATSPWVYRAGSRPITVPGLSYSLLTCWQDHLTGTVSPPWLTDDWVNDGDLESGCPYGLYVVESRLSRELFREVDLDSAEGQRAFAGSASPWNDPVEPFDLSEFRDGGGKLITYMGVASCNAHLHTILAWQRAAELGSTGGSDAAGSGTLSERTVEAVNQWFRTFLVPGMGHCGGGIGAQDAYDQLLHSLVDWVETGTAPDEVVAHNPMSGRSFLLCAEPSRAVFSGVGDVADAASWERRLEPRSLDRLPA